MQVVTQIGTSLDFQLKQARLSKGATGVRCSGRHYFTGGKKWKTTQGLVPEVAGLQPRLASAAATSF